MFRTLRKGSVQLMGCVSQQCACQRVLTAATMVSNAGTHSLADEFQKVSQSQGPATKTSFRTSISDPGKHTLSHEGLFYTVSREDYQQWCSPSVAPEITDMMNAFNEHCFMVRKPSLEIIHYLKQADYSMPSIRYILYGRQGCGKSVTLAQVMHYCGLQDWLVAYVKFGSAFCRYARDPQISSHNPARVDTPFLAASFLKQFTKTNEALIKKLDLRLAHRYVWNRRESAEIGDPLMDILLMGTERVNYATDCVGALVKELKNYASSGQCKVLFAVNGVNGFWGTSRVRLESKLVPTENFSIIHNFKKMFRNDWNGGAVVCSVDVLNSDKDKRESYLPRYLLGREAFESLDPILPIHVDKYSDKEMYSCLEYLCERNWIQNPKGHSDEGKREITFLSEKNPYEVIRVTQGW